MRATVIVLALVLAGCPSKPVPTPPAAAPASPAAEPLAKPPSNRFEETLASLPEPNADAAFVMDADVAYGMDLKGRRRMTVEPGVFEGRAAWLVVEEDERPAFPGPGTPAASERRTSWLSRELRVLRTDLVTRTPGQTQTACATAEGTRVTKTLDGHEPESWTLVRGVDDRFTLAAALLYFRMCPVEVETGSEESPDCPRVTGVDQQGDGRIACHAFVGGTQTFITLVGPERDPAVIEEFVGGHHWSKMVARAPRQRSVSPR